MPLPEYNLDGKFLLAVKRVREAHNASVVKSETTSRWMVLVDMQAKLQTYDLTSVRRRADPHFFMTGATVIDSGYG